MRDHLRRIGLGSVQFGTPYGIANKENITPALSDVSFILETARASGITVIDTAINYGESERLLGELGMQGFNVVTKLPSLRGAGLHDWRSMVEQIKGSVNRLGLSKLHAVLLHDQYDLTEVWGSEVYRALVEIKNSGLADLIGVSIYDPNILPEIIPKYDIDIVQAPLNLVDRRIIDPKFIELLQKANIKLHTRSCFLQGLLLMDISDIPPRFGSWLEIFRLFDSWCIGSGISKVEACLHFVLSFPIVETLIVGVQETSQFLEIIKVCETLPKSRGYPEIASLDLELIDPSKWTT